MGKHDTMKHFITTERALRAVGWGQTREEAAQKVDTALDRGGGVGRCCTRDILLRK